MALPRYEIKDTDHPEWRATRRNDLDAARRHVAEIVRLGTPAGRFIIIDRQTKQEVK